MSRNVGGLLYLSTTDEGVPVCPKHNAIHADNITWGVVFQNVSVWDLSTGYGVEMSDVVSFPSVAAAKGSKAASVIKKRPAIKKTKVRTSVHFFRPKTLTKTRAPKCPTKAVPRRPRMDHFKVIKSCVTTESAMKKIEEINTLVFLCDPR